MGDLNDLILAASKRAYTDPHWAVAYAQLCLVTQLERVAEAIDRLGLNVDHESLTRPPGALEFIGMQLRDGVQVNLSGTVSVESENG